MEKIAVHHWRFEDGKTCPNPGSKWESDPPPRGWYCWAYPQNDRAFEKWMHTNCPTADITHRFNSGDPMYTVYLNDPQEAVIFQLKWL
jgi:hypothetical protein